MIPTKKHLRLCRCRRFRCGRGGACRNDRGHHRKCPERGNIWWNTLNLNGIYGVPIVGFLAKTFIGVNGVPIRDMGR